MTSGFFMVSKLFPSEYLFKALRAINKIIKIIGRRG